MTSSSPSLQRRERYDNAGVRNQVPPRSGFNFLCDGARVGHGKAQSSLEKIINVIATCKAIEVSNESAARAIGVSDDLSCGRSDGFGFDLKLGMEDSNEAEFPIRDGNVIGGAEISILEGGDDGEEDDEVEDRSAEEKNRIGGDGDGGGYLSLLIEAAQVVSGQFQDEEEEDVGPMVLGSELVRESGGSDRDGYGLVRKSQRLKISSLKKAQVNTTRTNTKLADNECWMMEVEDLDEDISPVVKSKRGRTQVLPYRFRDSVIEPWSSITSGKRRSR